jgi:hypothetical protein
LITREQLAQTLTIQGRGRGVPDAASAQEVAGATGAD